MSTITNGRPIISPLTAVTTTTKKLPSRIGIHALQKWGKTSFAAQAPNPIFLCTRGEDGLMTLIDSGQLPPIPHFPLIDTWNDAKLALSELTVHDHPYKTLVIDTLNGLARLKDEHVCRTKFDNNPVDFDAWGRGHNVGVGEFIELTVMLAQVTELQEKMHDFRPV